MFHLGIELAIVDLASVVDHLSVRNQDTDVATRACTILQRMTVVGGCHERGESRPILLGASEDRTSVHLADRQRLLQRGLLRGTDGIELVEVEVRRYNIFL